MVPANGLPEFMRLADVARHLGIGDTTLKRWADEGRIRCERTLGGHRRFPRVEVLRVKARLGGADAFAPGGPPGPSDSRLWLDVPGDPFEPTALTGRLLLLRADARDWAEAGDRLCAGLLAEIGERWAHGRMSCAEEHAMSRAVEIALAKIGHQLPVPPRAPSVILACPPGERHTLGLTLVETVLRERRARIVFLGADVPSRDLVEAIRRERPIAVGLSASSAPRPSHELLEPAKAAAAACAEAGARLVLGGSAAWPPVRGATRVLTLMDLASLIDPLLAKAQAVRA